MRTSVGERGCGASEKPNASGAHAAGGGRPGDGCGGQPPPLGWSGAAIAGSGGWGGRASGWGGWGGSGGGGSPASCIARKAGIGGGAKAAGGAPLNAADTGRCAAPPPPPMLPPSPIALPTKLSQRPASASKPQAGVRGEGPPSWAEGGIATCSPPPPPPLPAPPPEAIVAARVSAADTLHLPPSRRPPQAAEGAWGRGGRRGGRGRTRRASAAAPRR